MTELTVCCVSRGDEKSLPFLRKMRDWCDRTNSEFLLAIDGADVPEFSSTCIKVRSLGYIESVLDSVIDHCSGDYIFRLDDDEFFSDKLSNWLEQNKSNFEDDVYSFSRFNLWKNEDYFIPGLYPDTQIRLTTKEKAKGRNKIHNISPYGFGTTLHLPILHYKFLIRSYEERKEIAEKYESVSTGAGFGDYLVYNLPEDYYLAKGVGIFYERTW